MPDNWQADLRRKTPEIGRPNGDRDIVIPKLVERIIDYRFLDLGANPMQEEPDRLPHVRAEIVVG